MNKTLNTRELTREQTGHTPEPWRIIQTITSYRIHSQPIGANKAGIEIAATYLRGDEDQANAERIVACVNALAGIANPSAVAGLVEAARRMVRFGSLVDREQLIVAIAALDSTVPKTEGDS